MSEEKVKEILYHTTEKQPGLIFAVIEQDNSPVTPNVNTDVTSCCRCGHCREMVELVEHDCCKRNPGCISTLPVSVDYFFILFSSVLLLNSYSGSLFNIATVLIW